MDASCLPSWTAYFTGRYGIHTGVVGHAGINANIRHRGDARGHLNSGQYRSLPSALRMEDHHTAFISPFPQRHGAWHVLDGSEEWVDTGGFGNEHADVVAGHAEDWLQSNATEEDWYLHVNFWDPFLPSPTDGTAAGCEFVVTGQAAWAYQRSVRWDDWLLLRIYYDGWRTFDPVEFYDLATDPHETENVASDHPAVAERGMALLNRWRGQRGIDAATGTNDGNPGAPRGLVDPLFEVVRDDGSFYIKDNQETYTQRLRNTSCEKYADRIEEDGSIVDQNPSEFLP